MNKENEISVIHIPAGEIVPVPVKDAEKIAVQLEQTNLPPWLWGGPEAIAKHIKEFPEGVVGNKTADGDYLGAMFAKKIWWDGAPGHFPPAYALTGKFNYDYVGHSQNGNTWVYTGIFLSPLYPFVDYHKVEPLIRGLEFDKKIKYTAYSLRTSNYHAHKAAKKSRGEIPYSFEEYAKKIHVGRHGDKPIDPFQCAFWWGSEHLKYVDPKAIEVTVSLSEFYNYQSTYHPEAWLEVSKNVWESFSEGIWTIKLADETATYTEGRVWSYPYFPPNGVLYRIDKLPGEGGE